MVLLIGEGCPLSSKLVIEVPDLRSLLVHPYTGWLYAASDGLLTVSDPASGVVLARVDALDLGDALTTGFVPLLDALEQCRVPLALDFARRPFLDFDTNVFESYPAIPFIIERFGGYPLNRLMWVLRTFPHVRVSTVGLTVHRGLDFLCDEIGPERIVFGSGWPRTPPGVELGQVLLNGLALEARRKIAGENFRTLMEAIG